MLEFSPDEWPPRDVPTKERRAPLRTYKKMLFRAAIDSTIDPVFKKILLNRKWTVQAALYSEYKRTFTELDQEAGGEVCETIFEIHARLIHQLKGRTHENYEVATISIDPEKCWSALVELREDFRETIVEILIFNYAYENDLLPSQLGTDIQYGNTVISDSFIDEPDKEEISALIKYRRDMLLCLHPVEALNHFYETD